MIWVCWIIISSSTSSSFCSFLTLVCSLPLIFPQIIFIFTWIYRFSMPFLSSFTPSKQYFNTYSKKKFILGWWPKKLLSWTSCLIAGFPDCECPSKSGVRGCRPRREPGHPLPVWPHWSVLCPHPGKHRQWPGEWVVSAGYWFARGRLATWSLILMILPSDLFEQLDMTWTRLWLRSAESLI